MLEDDALVAVEDAAILFNFTNLRSEEEYQMIWLTIPHFVQDTALNPASTHPVTP